MTAINRITGDDVDAFTEDPTFERYQRIATKSAIYPGQGTPLGLAYCALKLNGEAGELAEHVGKAMRDDDLMPIDYVPNSDDGVHPNNAMMPVVQVAALNGKLTPTRHALIIKEVGDVLWYLSAICNELGIDLELVAGSNLHKLWDRTERDQLRGSGDER